MPGTCLAPARHVPGTRMEQMCADSRDRSGSSGRARLASIAVPRMRRTDLPDGFYHVTGRATGGELLYRGDLDGSTSARSSLVDRPVRLAPPRPLRDGHPLPPDRRDDPRAAVGRHASPRRHVYEALQQAPRAVGAACSRGASRRRRSRARSTTTPRSSTSARTRSRQGSASVAETGRGRNSAFYRNACVPVSAAPMTSVCTSCVPS